MNAVLTQDGRTIVTETSIEESKMLYSILEFVSRYDAIHGRMLEDEVEFASKLAEELGRYLEYHEEEFEVD